MEVTLQYCGFNCGWGGLCKTQTDGSRCDKHKDLVCCSCGKPATKLCDYTGIQFVCGSALCEGCVHGPPPKEGPNWFNLGGEHKPKREAYRDWAEYWKDKSPSTADMYTQMAEEAAQEKHD